MKIYWMVLLFLIGCSTPKVKGPYTFQKPEEGKAVVYLYRLDSPIDSLNPDVPLFFINDQETGKLVLGGHYVQLLEPGKVEVAYKNSLFGIRLPWKVQRLSIETRPNEVYYVRFGIGGMMRITDFKVVPKEEAQLEIIKTKEMINN